jgi:hypothetical protein
MRSEEFTVRKYYFSDEEIAQALGIPFISRDQLTIVSTSTRDETQPHGWRHEFMVTVKENAAHSCDTCQPPYCTR